MRIAQEVLNLLERATQSQNRVPTMRFEHLDFDSEMRKRGSDTKLGLDVFSWRGLVCSEGTV